MTAYSTLIAARTTSGSIKEWANNGLIPVTSILTDAQAWIYQRLRVRPMLTTATGTMTTSQGTITLPSRFRRGSDFRFTGTNAGRAVLKQIEFVRSAYSWDSNGSRTLGKPRYFAPDATNIVFDNLADQNYTYDFQYFQALPALSTDTETNFLTEDHPHLLRSTCIYFGNEWTKNNKERDYWLAVAMADVAQANIGDDEELDGAEIDIDITGELAGGDLLL